MEDKNMIVHQLFPQIVGKFNFERDFTEKELKFILNQNKEANNGNYNSINKYILKDNNMSDINDFLLKSVNVYFQSVFKPKNKVDVYITQSWLNYTEKNMFHHEHAHPNSFLSGVFYINANPSEDKIFFTKEEYKLIRVETDEYDMLNADAWWLEAGTGMLYIFPSSLKHMVKNKESEDLRISLSFNTFLEGVVSQDHNMMDLKLIKN